MNPFQIHQILAAEELLAEQADERAARSIVRLRKVAGPRSCATGLRAVTR